VVDALLSTLPDSVRLLEEKQAEAAQLQEQLKETGSLRDQLAKSTKVFFHFGYSFALRRNASVKTNTPCSL
jgi:hypothetical protein